MFADGTNGNASQDGCMLWHLGHQGKSGNITFQIRNTRIVM